MHSLVASVRQKPQVNACLQSTFDLTELTSVNRLTCCHQAAGHQCYLFSCLVSVPWYGVAQDTQHSANDNWLTG